MPCTAPSRNNLGVLGPCAYKALQRAGPAAPTTAEGGLGWWKTDEASGATVAADAFGANPANYVGGPIPVVPGAQGGQAVLLDGATQGLETAAGFPTCGDVFTLMCWARLSISPPARQMALFSRTSAYLFRMSNTNLYLTIYAVGNPVNSPGGIVPTDGLWHHYCVAKNGTAAVKLYFDGVDVSASPNPALVCPNGAGTVRIGCSHNGAFANEAFPGAIDEPMIFNTYLSAARIAEFAKGKDTSADSLCQFHYQMKYGQRVMQQPIVVEP
jgi:Concanavalin A-like lectin/glucanases superfamily